MACMGPDLKHARERGEQVGRELLARIIAEHRMFDLPGPGVVAEGRLFYLPEARERWAAAKAAFVAAVGELFVEDAANSF